VEAEKAGTIKNFSRMMVSTDVTSATVWYSPVDGVHLTYARQKLVMEGMMKHWSTILQSADIEFEAQPCEVYMTVYPAVFTTGVINEYFKSEAKVQELAGLLNINLFPYISGISWRGVFPLNYADLTEKGLNNMAGTPDKKYNKPDDKGRAWVGFNKFNSVICPVSVKHNSGKPNRNFNGVYAFLDAKKSKRFVYMPLKEGVQLKFTTALGMMIKFRDHLDGGVSVSEIMGVDAFLPKPYVTDDVLTNGDQVFEHVLLPNDFDISFCYSLLDPHQMGSSLMIDTSEFFNMWEEYKNKCPMLGMTGGFAVFGYQREIIEFPGMMPKPPAFRKPNYDPKVYKGYYTIDMSGVSYTDENPKYKEETDKYIEIEKTNREIVQAKEKEKIDQPSEITPDKTIVFEIDSPEPLELPGSLKSKLPNQTEKEKTPSPSSPSESDVGEENDDPMDEDVRTCFNLLKRYVAEFSRDEPEYKVGKANFLFVLKVLLAVPQGENCRRWKNFSFTDFLVKYNEGDEPVMMYSYRPVPPEELEDDQKDKLIWEIRFYNDYFENLKEIYLYIPNDQVIGNWEQFDGILWDFHEFVQENLGEMRTLVGLMKTVIEKVNDKLKQETDASDIFTCRLGPNGPNKKLSEGSSSDLEIDRFNLQNQRYYINYSWRIDSPSHFYDLIYQSWYMGNNYIMVKIQGTQVNYKVMVYKYVHAAKLNMITQSIYEMIYKNYIGPQRVMSIPEIKYRTDDAVLHHFSDKFPVKHTRIDLDGPEYQDVDTGLAAMKSSDDNTFLFNYEIQKVGLPMSVRGFIHTRENLPVVNIFFRTEYFHSEYIIPLGQANEFQMNLDSIMSESVHHFFELFQEIQKVESPNASSEDLENAKKLGRYNFQNLVGEVLGMLNKYAVYACVAEQTFATPRDEVDLKYSWQAKEMYIPNENFLLVRSNNLFKGFETVCEGEEKKNPPVLHMYSTNENGEMPGYAIRLNGISHDEHKEIKTTYHFVKNQDYAHFEALKKMIDRFLKQIFEPKS
jgi:hypothetical protein